MSRISIASLAAVVIGQVARADVLVVDPSGNGDFTDLPPAVAAALDGDVILVRGGTYSGFTVTDRSVSIVADAGAAVTVVGGAEIAGLAASRTVVLAGLTVLGGAGTSPRVALRVSGCDGSVRAQGCEFRAADLVNPGQHGAVLEPGDGSVAFVACTFRGGEAQGCGCFDPPGRPGGHGILARGLRVALHDCDAIGGEGAHADGYGGDGGAGLRLELAASLAFAHASGSSFRGGDGGDVCDWIWCEGGDGGPGVLLDDGTIGWILESSIDGGLAGAVEPSQVCNGVPGSAGIPLAGGGDAFPLVPPALRLTAPAVVRESTPMALTIAGRPGDPVHLLVSSATAFVGIPSWRGVRLAQRRSGADLMMVLGTIPASGVLTTSIPAPALPAGTASVTLHLQALRISPLDGRTLGSFAPVTVLDASL